MKKVFLSSFSLALMFGVWNFSGAIAAPDSVFNPILRDIQNQLPRGMVMRLPSVLRVYDTTGRTSVYPAVKVSNDGSGLSVFFYAQPQCEFRACMRGRLSVSKGLASFEKSLVSDPISNQSHPNQPNRFCGIISRKVITLKDSVEAFSVDFDTCGVSSGRFNSIIWNQDGYYFYVSVGNGTTNVDIARSMANETPIRSNRYSSEQETQSINPHPFFDPFISEIKANLPSSLYIKIPKQEFENIRFPLALSKMTSIIRSDGKSLTVVFCANNSVGQTSDRPFCYSVGFLGYMHVFPSSDRSSLDRYLKQSKGVWQNRKLMKGFTARCWSPAEKLTKSIPYCIWQENKQFFVVTDWDGLVDAVVNGAVIRH
jgi:hypothetical protein